MSRTKNRSANKRTKECMFLGNSLELKAYLISKKKSFEELITKNNKKLSYEQICKIKGFVEAIEEMLDQKYFRGERVYSMSEMLEEIKLERDELIKEIEAMIPEVQRAKEMAYDAYKEEKGYYANKYEDIYNTHGQVLLRNLVDEYQALNFQVEGLEKCRKALWWILGVIHRPTGFFEKVLEV